MSEALTRREQRHVRKRDHAAVARVSGENNRELLAFVVGSETYALPLDAVREILKPPPVTPVPRSPRDVLGVISVRGRITTVVDLRSRLGAVMAELDKHSRVLLVDDGDEVLGMLVDRVLQVHRLADDEVEIASVVSGDLSEYVVGIGRPRQNRSGRADRASADDTSRSDILILLDHMELLRR